LVQDLSAILYYHSFGAHPDPGYNPRMTRFPSPLRTLAIVSALAAGATCWPGLAAAQSAPAQDAAAQDTSAQAAPVSDGDTIRLTDEQRADIIEHNTSARAAAARGELPDSGIRDRGVHGEVGFMIGTHGARGAYGEAEVPLGDHGSAAIAIDSEHYDFGRHH
jgi:hypothetical protein